MLYCGEQIGTGQDPQVRLHRRSSLPFLIC